MSLHEKMRKVTVEHTSKYAYVYVRQSSLRGVRENVVGGQRQRDVAKLAIQMGWPKENIRVVDEDQARSGSTTEGRYGYIDMLNDIGDGRVGAVFSLEPARVGRDSADWHILIKLCDHTDTLIIDPHGIYSASDFNDNTMMKVNALLVELELKWITERLQGAKRALAAKGELRCSLPIGYVYDKDKKLVFDPDKEIQRMVRLVFTLFRRLGSASKVARYFNKKGLKFPSHVRSDSGKVQYDWRPLKVERVCSMMRNPIYAGTYVFGRTRVKKKTVRKEGAPPKVVKYQEKVKRSEWPFVFYDAHPAYITFAKFLENEQRLKNNLNVPGGEVTGAPREGAALLQGLALCGKCGRRMNVGYPRAAFPRYSCIGDRVQFAGKACQTLASAWIDRAVEQAFLDTLQPAQLEMSLQALERSEEQAYEIDRQWDSRLRQAKKAVAEAEERLLATDHRNQRAYARVQSNFEQKQVELDLLRRTRDDEAKLTIKSLSAEERGAVLALAKDFPQVWNAETMDMATRKHLLRCLIADVTITRDGLIARVDIRWKTGASTTLTVTLLTNPSSLTLPAHVIELIKKLVPEHTDGQIATALNDAGFVNGWGQPFTGIRVLKIRSKYEIRKYHTGCLPDQRDDGRYSSAAVAEILGVSRGVVGRWCKEGRLDGILDASVKRWWIKTTPEELAEFKKVIRRPASPCGKSYKHADLTLSVSRGREGGANPNGVAL